LTEREIDFYEWSTHKLKLKPGVVNKVESKLSGSLVHGVRFMVAANGVNCYEGVFTTSLSSFSQSCPVICFEDIETDPDRWDTELMISLGYPGPEYFRGKDPRSDPRIRAALLALCKLR
jgi:hypothetical protein